MDDTNDKGFAFEVQIIYVVWYSTYAAITGRDVCLAWLGAGGSAFGSVHSFF